MLRSLALLVLALVSCKTADEKQCDSMFERYERCNGAALDRVMRASADEFCYISLGSELQPGDTTSYAAMIKRGLEECSTITECEPLKACFAKHDCLWRVAGPGATPQFACWK